MRIGRNNKIVIALLAMLVVLVSCGTKKNVVSGGSVAQEDLGKNVFLKKVCDNAVGSNNITSKIDFTLRTGDKEISVAGSLHMRKDDVIRIQLTPLGLMEVGRLEFTKDYVLIMDRMNKEYIKADYNQVDFLKNNGIDFYALQSIFWNELFVPGMQKVTESSFEQYGVDMRPMLTDISYKKGKMLYNWTADSKTGVINKLNVVYNGSQDEKTSVDCDYSAFSPVGNKRFPASISMRFSTTALGNAKNAGFTLKLKNIGTDSNWESRTAVSGKYRKVSVEELMNKLMKL